MLPTKVAKQGQLGIHVILCTKVSLIEASHAKVCKYFGKKNRAT
jgi:hypothetical protein